MKKAVKIILIILCAAVLVLAAVYVYFRYIMKNQIMDGPGSVYTWTDYELYSKWVEVARVDWRGPVELDFSEGSFTMSCDGKEQTFAYALPEGTEIEGQPSGEVYLTLTDCTEFENLFFHEEYLEDGAVIPVLSATIFEYDGRGEIVIAEYVREEDLKKLPADFRSSSCIARNDSTPISSVMVVD